MVRLEVKEEEWEWHTTTFADMDAFSSAVTSGHRIGHLVLLAGCVLTCCLGANSGMQAADGICSRISSSLCTCP